MQVAHTARVIPAQAGIQFGSPQSLSSWIPDQAGDDNIGACPALSERQFEARWQGN